MNKSFVLLFKKEVLSGLQSKLAILFIAGFLVLSFQWFLATAFVYNEASFKNLFLIVPYLWILLLPSLTLHFWGAEYKFKTLELLETLPISWPHIVLAKFFANTVFMTFSLLSLCFCFFVFTPLGSFDWGVVFSSLCGSWLLGLLCLTLCHAWSVLLAQNFLAYLASTLTLLFFQFIAHPFIAQNAPQYLRPALDILSFAENLNPFLVGVIAFKTVILYFGHVVLILYLVCKKNPTRRIKFTIVMLELVLLICVLWIPNIWALDTTRNHDHSLNHPTLELAKKLEDQLTIKLYFSPRLPYEIQKIANQFKEQLLRLKHSSPYAIIIEDMNLNSDIQKEQAQQVGITPLLLHVSEQNKKTTQDIFMGATFHYKDQVTILNEITNPDRFEYNLALQLLKLQNKTFPKLGVIVNEKSKNDFSHALEIFQQITNVIFIEATENDLNRFDLKALVVLDPVSVPQSLSLQLKNMLNENIPVLILAQPSHINDNVTLQPLNTGLENFLKDFGFKITNELVLDEDQNALAIFDLGQDPVEIPYPFWLKLYQNEISKQHPITSGLTELLVPWTHAIEPDDTRPSAVYTTLLQSSPNSYFQEKNHFSISPDYQKLLKDLPRVSSRPLAIEIKASKESAPLIVVSSNQFMRNNFLNHSYFREASSNATFVANMIEFITWGQPLMALRSQGQPSPRLKNISQHEKQLIHLSLIFLALAWPFSIAFVTAQWQKYKIRKFKKI